MKKDQDSQLQDLEERINKARKSNASDDSDGPKNNFGATRVSIELMSGVLVGSGLGFIIDKYLDTLPIFFIICFFFGVAAGGLNIYKLATKQQNTNLDEEK